MARTSRPRPRQPARGVREVSRHQRRHPPSARGRPDCFLGRARRLLGRSRAGGGGASLCRFRLEMLTHQDGDLEPSSKLLQASLESGRRAGYEEMVVMSLLALGHLAVREGRLEEAGAFLSEGLVTWRDRGGPRQIASLIEAFAVLAAARGDAPRALRLAASAEILRKEIAAAPAYTFQRDLMERLRAGLEGLGDQASEAARLDAPMSREEAIAYALTAGGLSAGRPSAGEG